MSKKTCFISYSHDYKNISKFEKINSLVTNFNDYINYSEKLDKSKSSNETIWKYLHDRIAGSSCTILLLTEDLLTYNKRKIEYKYNDFINSGWIYNEISASLRDWEDNRINGVVCIVEDHLTNKIIDFNNTIYGYKLPKILFENQDYIVFVPYSYFIKYHSDIMDKAIKNREEQIKSNGKRFKIVYDLHNKFSI
ncbi:MAG: TIR domain-containing protein [Metamycoplasmataceae bacterium]